MRQVRCVKVIPWRLDPDDETTETCPTCNGSFEPGEEGWTHKYEDGSTTTFHSTCEP